MRPERIDKTLFKDKFRYACGPFITCAANGDWLVTWNMSMELEIGPHSPRRYLHPPDNPEFCNYMIRSRDKGKTWEAPRVVPGSGGPGPSTWLSAFWTMAKSWRPSTNGSFSQSRRE